MSDKMKVKIAFASAIIRQLWIAGLITKAELDAMEKKNKQGEKQNSNQDLPASNQSHPTA